MLTVGTFIGNYRILMQLSQTSSCGLYFAEHTYQQSNPSLILFYPTITLKTSADQQAFRQRASGGTIQPNGKTFAIQDVGIIDQHPYLVTAYGEEAQDALREHLHYIDMLLSTAQNQHPNDDQAYIDAFFRTFTATPFVQPQPTMDNAPTPTPVQYQPLADTPNPTPVQYQSITDNIPTPNPTPVQYQPLVDTPSPTPVQYQPLADTPTFVPPPPPPDTPPPLFIQGEMAGPLSMHQTNTVQNKPFFPPRAPRRNVLSWRPKRWQAIVLLVLLLALLAWGGSYLYTIIPAAGATITITPVRKTLSHVYNLSIGPGTTTDPLTVTGRQIVATSQKQTQTVNATGQGTHPATQAKGNVVLSQIQIDNPDPNGNELAISTIPDANGIQITTDQDVAISQGGTVIIPAHAETAGSAGNIPAHDLDGSIEIVDALTQGHIGTGFVSNPDPFTGGNDAVNFTFVQQSDIDSASQALTNQLTPGTKTQVQSQKHADESLLQDPQCTSNTSSDHNANDEAGNVTVTVSVTCTGLAYTQQAIHDTAVKAYVNDGKTQFGSSYDVVDNALVSKPVGPSSALTFTVTVNGAWAYSYTAQRQQDLKNSIAGKPQKTALQVLQSRRDIQHVTLTTSGWFGSAVPQVPGNINIVVEKVSGIQA